MLEGLHQGFQELCVRYRRTVAAAKPVPRHFRPESRPSSRRFVQRERVRLVYCARGTHGQIGSARSVLASANPSPSGSLFHMGKLSSLWGLKRRAGVTSTFRTNSISYLLQKAAWERCASESRFSTNRTCSDATVTPCKLSDRDEINCRSDQHGGVGVGYSSPGAASRSWGIRRDP
jgi:hypothetical protein